MTASVADAGEARARVDRIKTGVEVIWTLIVESYNARDWQALGYATWDEMCTREFGTSRIRLPREERAETVQSLREAGLSLRAISAVTGSSKDTVARALAPVSNETPDGSAPRTTRVAELLRYSDSLDEALEVEEMGAASEAEFEEALAAARADGDLSRQNVIAHLPAAGESGAPVVTGLDGKTYNPRPKAQVHKPPRKPLVEVAKTRGFAIREATDSLMRVFDDDRYRANEKQVADALRGHLLYVAETVAAVLDQLP